MPEGLEGIQILRPLERHGVESYWGAQRGLLGSAYAYPYLKRPMRRTAGFQHHGAAASACASSLADLQQPLRARHPLAARREHLR